MGQGFAAGALDVAVAGVLDVVDEVAEVVGRVGEVGQEGGAYDLGAVLHDRRHVHCLCERMV